MSRSISALVSVALLVNVASARVVPDWPYDKLAREADVVVIARAESSVDTSDVPANEPFRAELVGVETKLAVRAVLKGKLNGTMLKLAHFRLKGLMPPNGPMLVRFRTADETRSKPAPEYLLFLKSRADGRFEPVTGQVDPILSVRQIANLTGP